MTQCFKKEKLNKSNSYKNSSWITRGLKKSSKRKQRLYEKLLERRNDKNEKAYKLYKNLLEKLN